ncbi:XRE family transcriptional regulator [Weissella viridescens]|uniref:XRE family transcriptional regulator n=1 Tax=Weissella viridescens TaxID=1629 RepID=A0A3P2RH63_WEIVI|nr:helix-turn-helix transcriptional regulator [Weissella viridescens]RRG18741.1 XRE family transcriptional regulator [Weissella viridescens]
MEIGKMIRKARQSRNMTQAALAEGIVSRTSIVKIEMGAQNPSYETVEKILEKLGLSIVELYEFENDSIEYQYNRVLSSFKQLFNSTQLSEIEELIRAIDRLNADMNNQVLDHVQTVLEAFRKIDSEDINKLKAEVMPVWSYLEKIDNWSEVDLYLINFILYYFDAITAENIVKHAVQRIDNNYPNLTSLKNALLVNLTSLFINQGIWDAAENYLKESIGLSKKLKRVDLVYINQIRLALINRDTSKLHDVLEKLNELGDEQLYLAMLEEIQKYNENL